MKIGKYFSILLLTIVWAGSQAQQSVALFANKNDSTAYAKLNAAIMALMQDSRTSLNNLSVRRLDSLMQLQRGYKDKIIGYKVIYKADNRFTSFEELQSGKIKSHEVTQLSISNPAFTALPKEVFTCTNLVALELVNTRIRKLPGSLRKLTKLKSIYIYNNVTSSTLKLGRNSTVHSLVIRGVNETNLPGNFKKFKVLDSLDLSRNIGLVHFPNVYRNKSLRKLNLLENNITLTDLKNVSGSSLEELNLMKNKIKVVPASMGSFSNLKKITFNYNEIEEIGNGLGNLKKLENLSFYQNKLSKLPGDLFDLSNLRSLDLYYNQLREVSPDLAKLNNLKILYLAYNQLAALPDNLGELPNIQEIYLHNNKLEKLPASVSELKNLKVLRINNNYFTSLPPGVLKLINLENLDISKNYIYHFPAELAQFRKLQIFSATNNPWENESDMKRILEELKSNGTIVHAP